MKLSKYEIQSISGASHICLCILKICSNISLFCTPIIMTPTGVEKMMRKDNKCSFVFLQFEM